ncbi:MAG: hypothetical protein ACJA2S_005569 [Cyclobacteriaceae bacterium]
MHADTGILPKVKPNKMCNVEDSFGIVFEVYTHSGALSYSPGGYERPKVDKN